MLAVDQANSDGSRFSFVRNLYFKKVIIGPELLCFLEADPVLLFVRSAFSWVVFEMHNMPYEYSLYTQ